MKTYPKLVLLVFCLSFTLLPVNEAKAVIPILQIIKQAIVKVIKAVDLKIQRLQNKKIALQNAQKTLENTLSKLKLKEISEWANKQKEQYRKYYEELSKIKTIITQYQRMRDILKKQTRLVDQYNRAWQVLQHDSHFTVAEVNYMGKVYSSILEESMKNIDQITDIVKSFTTKMTDAKRLELINRAADRVDTNYDDLITFNRQNRLLSLQRARSQQEVDVIKKLYQLH